MFSDKAFNTSYTKKAGILYDGIKYNANANQFDIYGPVGEFISPEGIQQRTTLHLTARTHIYNTYSKHIPLINRRTSKHVQ